MKYLYHPPYFLIVPINLPFTFFPCYFLSSLPSLFLPYLPFFFPSYLPFFFPSYLPFFFPPSLLPIYIPSSLPSSLLSSLPSFVDFLPSSLSTHTQHSRLSQLYIHPLQLRCPPGHRFELYHYYHHQLF